MVIQYRQGIHRGEGTVHWDGEQFVAASLPEAGGVSLAVELNRIEEGLFTRRAYRQTLRQLAEFEQRVIASRLRPEDKTDLLFEAYYHEALCYRELGRSRDAVNRYWALWRRQPDRTWGMLAQHWLQSGG